MRILPAILTNQVDEYLRQLTAISEFTDEVDVDVMDGIFVAEKSVPIEDLPKVPNTTINFDLMVKDANEYVKKILTWKKKNEGAIGIIYVHVESEYDIKELLTESKNQFKLGFSLKIETAIENFLNVFDTIQKIDKDYMPCLLLKTVQIGKQGNPYHPEVLGKISAVRKAGFNGEIYLDGGINPDIVSSLKTYNIAGVSVGSFISHGSDPMRAFNTLREATWKQNID